MSRVIYLASKKAPARAQAQAASPPPESLHLVDRGRLAHDLKNCMSVLLLGLATLDGDGDQWILSAHSRDVFEGAVFEMNGIVEALIDEHAGDAETATPRQVGH
jgi:hypothetical protein